MASQAKPSGALDTRGHGKIEWHNFSQGYRPHWSGREGFRELFQNWSDAIRRSFSLSPWQLQLYQDIHVVEGRGTMIEITARRRPQPVATSTTIQLFAPPLEALNSASGRGARSDGLLGFIRFNPTENGHGWIELVNFESYLEVTDLRMGNSSKRGQTNQAGYHGEGYKIAMMVFTRQGYSCETWSSGRRLDWGWYQVPDEDFDSLRVRYVEPAKGKSKKPPSQDNTLCANLQRDVMVRVGERSVAACPSKVSLNAFQGWLTVLLDVDKPVNRLSLDSQDGGDILIATSHRNKVYNMGLMLFQGNERNGYLYGYNFLAGSTPPDRSQLLDSGGKHDGMPYRFIHNLWRNIIRHQRDIEVAPEKNALQHYTDILNNHQDGIYAQEAIYAEQYIERDIAKMIWTRLLSKDRNAFYFVSFPGDILAAHRDSEIIQTDLGKTPTKLSPKLWKILRSSQGVQCRTPTEQRQRKFNKCVKLEFVQAAAHSTAYDVLRAFYAAWALNEETKRPHVQTIFVDAQELRIDCTYDRVRSIARIHSKWLSPILPRQEDDVETEIARVSACDEIANDLYAVVLSEVGNQLDPSKTTWMRNVVRNAIANIAYNVSVKPGLMGGSLEVSWNLIGERRFALGASGARLLLSLHINTACRESQESRPGPNDLFQQRSATANRDPIIVNEPPCNACGGPCFSVPVAWRSCFLEVDDLRKDYFVVVALGEAGSINSRPSNIATPPDRPSSPPIGASGTPDDLPQDEYDDAADTDMEDVDGYDDGNADDETEIDDHQLRGLDSSSPAPALRTARGEAGRFRADRRGRSRDPSAHSQVPHAGMQDNGRADLRDRFAGGVQEQRAAERLHVCPEPPIRLGAEEMTSDAFLGYLHGRKTQGYLFPHAYRFQKTTRPEGGVLVTSQYRPSAPEIKDEEALHVPKLEDGEDLSLPKRRRIAERPGNGVGSSINTAIDLD